MLSDDVYRRADQALAADDHDRATRFGGSHRPGRQPVHTVYVPADRYGVATIGEWRTAALAALDEHGPLPGAATDLDSLVRAKLHREPIEDLRIDVEDGYGNRPDDEEDRDVQAAAAAVTSAVANGTATPWVGLRIKSLEGATRHRAIRSFDLFVHTLLEPAGVLPQGFRVTLPKVTSVAQVAAMVAICRELESAHGLPGGRLQFEIQVETPQAILGPDGTASVARMIHASDGRCVGLHYGTYDYSASVGVAAAFQSLDHPAADHAKAVMQVAAAGTGVPVCDGSTNILPVGDREDVRAGWQLHLQLVRRSLERGFYQGWDLHPAQLPSRFAATFGFYRDSMPAAVSRLENYLLKATSGIMDEPATARALAGYLWGGLGCGAVSEDDIAALRTAAGPAFDHGLLQSMVTG